MLKLRIVSPEKVEYNGDVENVKVPGILGNFEILNNHAPIISALQDGMVEYTDGDAGRGWYIDGVREDDCFDFLPYAG